VITEAIIGPRRAEVDNDEQHTCIIHSGIIAKTVCAGFSERYKESGGLGYYHWCKKSRRVICRQSYELSQNLSESIQSSHDNRISNPPIPLF